MMKQSTKDKAEGSFHDLKGTVKRKAGELTNDPGFWKPKASLRKSPAKSQKKIGQAEEVVEKP